MIYKLKQKKAEKPTGYRALKEKVVEAEQVQQKKGCCGSRKNKITAKEEEQVVQAQEEHAAEGAEVPSRTPRSITSHNPNVQQRTSWLMLVDAEPCMYFMILRPEVKVLQSS